jgi:hypothetical protein
MTTLLSLSIRLYSATLPLYPPDLRRDFGREMAEVFAEDLVEALRHSGIAGFMRVWYCALSELIRIAAPSQAENPAVAVPFIIFVLCEAVMSGELLMAFRHQPMALDGGPMPLSTIPLFILPLSIAAAFTAFVAVLAGSRSLPAQMKVSSD